MAKPGNDSAESASKASSASTDAALSNHVFANPQQFMQALQKDVADMNTRDRSGVSKHDFEICAATCSDPTERAAAQIASNHFNELQGMAGGLNGVFDTRPYGDRPAITDTDMRFGMASVDSAAAAKFEHAIGAKNLTNEVMYSALGVASTVCGGIMMIMPEPVLTKVGGAVFVGFGMVDFYGVKKMHNDQAAEKLSLQNELAQRRKMIESWKEFGGR
jgi:hypothetical protein